MLILLILLIFFVVLVFFGCSPSADELPDLLKDEAQIAEQIRFLKQCYLMSQAEELVRFRHGKDGKKASTDKFFPRYRYISTITDSPHKVLGALTFRPEGQSLLEMPNDKVATLSPMIRLWKRIPAPAKKGKYREYEFPFRGAYSPDRNKDPLKPSNYGSEAGIQDFSFKLAGTNPAEADKFINVSIKFYFASMGDLFRDWSGIHLNKRGSSNENSSQDSHMSTSLRFVDLINYNLKDPVARGLLGSSSDAKTGEKNAYYFDGSFQILAEVGWHNHEAWTALILQLTSHELSFNQDGSLTITVDYIGRIEGALAGYQMNIFWVPPDYKLKELMKDLVSKRKKGAAATEASQLVEDVADDLMKDGLWNATKDRPGARAVRKRLLAQAVVHASDRAGLGGQPASYSRAREDRLEWILVEVLRREEIGTAGGSAETVRQSRLDAYRKLPKEEKERLIKLRDAAINRYLGDARDTLVEKLDERAKQVGAVADRISKEVYSSQEASRLKRYARIMQYLDEQGRVFTLTDNASALGIFSLKQLDSRISVAIDQRTTAGGGRIVQSDAAARTEEKIRDGATATARGKKAKIKLVSNDVDAIKQNEIKMPFIFLGDLFDALIGILREEYGSDESGNPVSNKAAREALEEITFLLGPVILETVMPKTKKLKRTLINMGDLPVSLDVFFAWFQREVIGKDLDKYNLLAFMKEIMSTIIFSAMGEGCYGNQKQLVRPGMLSTLIKKNGKDEPRVGRNQMNVALKELKAGRGGVRMSGNEYEQVLYLFSREQEMGHLNGDYDSNEESGIYHLFVGSGKGLVKKIAFAKTDFAYLRESRITNQADETANDGFLREKYDATITMIGNALFQPGQHLFIDPRLPSSPTEIRAAEKMGFTGYYFVHQVNHILGAGVYQTEVKAIHQGPANLKGAVPPTKLSKIYNSPTAAKIEEPNVPPRPPDADTKTPGGKMDSILRAGLVDGKLISDKEMLAISKGDP